jgi:hypothetical protein
MSGIIKFSKYHPGKFLVSILKQVKRIVVTAFARTILYSNLVRYASNQGTDAVFFIKFGSRVDLFYHLELKLMLF